MPTKSHAPIIASTLAAAVAVIPKSWQSGMKWVPTSPLVDSPQTKNVPNNSQNVRVPADSRNVANAVRTALPVAARTGSSCVAPNGAIPRSAGWSRPNNTISNPANAQAVAGGTSAQRQP